MTVHAEKTHGTVINFTPRKGRVETPRYRERIVEIDGTIYHYVYNEHEGQCQSAMGSSFTFMRGHSEDAIRYAGTTFDSVEQAKFIRNWDERPYHERPVDLR